MSLGPVYSRNRRDANEPVIKDWLETNCGCLCIRIDECGIGDLIVVYKVSEKRRLRHMGLLEVKTAEGKLRPAQKQFYDSARKLRMPYAVVRTPAEAEAAVQAWRKERR
jgi:hypothetical protein